MTGEHTYREIMSQPVVWEDALREAERKVPDVLALINEHAIEEIILTGCGSTYYLSLMGAVLLQEHGQIRTRALPASEIMLFRPGLFLAQGKTMLIMVSRSGETRETIEAARLFRKHKLGPTVAVTCHSEHPLALEADLVLAIDSAREQSRAQTRSFSSMAVILQALAGAMASSEWRETLSALPAQVKRLLDGYESLARTYVDEQVCQQYVFLGSGALYSLACEAMLKMMETTVLPSFGFHALEFLHGPRYIVNTETTVVALLNESILDEELRALQDSAGRGARLFVVGEDDTLPGLDGSVALVPLQSGLPLWARAILYLPVLQLLAYYQSMALGRNPDQPGQKAS